MNRYICIHGHFYQPPRENPWLEAIELQESAYPYHDWNERITSECYAPNSASRILNAERNILNIVNNFSQISFNFGPTLLSWMENHSPVDYQKILDADRESQKRFSGHGSAIAQVYNHMIMPLASSLDERTQVIWGIKDFEYRFKRYPEGMWLAETAVNIETLEILAEYNIKFTILAPHQARRLRKIGQQEWENVEKAQIDPQRAYLCRLPSGKSINIFFYDGPVSRELAFEDLLKNGTRFAERLTSTFPDNSDEPRLVNIATDGETYGHHQNFGDMALAFCLHHIQENNLAQVTVYGEFLEKFPPAYEVDILEDTSWSCVHGIERWRSDCGCNSGMHPQWHQKWREPLRNALDWLRNSLLPVYETHMSKYTDDAWRIRDEYIAVILDRSPESVEKFLKNNTNRELSREEKVTVLRLLELQRHAMLMYTSCGWFFDEISGIETIQILQYAARVIQLARDIFKIDYENEFINSLQLTPSNVEEIKNGATAYERMVKPATIDLMRVGAHHAIASLFNDSQEAHHVFCYSAENEFFERKLAGKQKLVVGKTKISSTITQAEQTVSFAALHLGDHNIYTGVRQHIGDGPFTEMKKNLNRAFSHSDIPEIIRLINDYFGTHKYSLSHLFKDEQKHIFDEIVKTTLDEIEIHFRQIYEHHYPLMQAKENMQVSMPKALATSIEFVLNKDLLNILEAEKINLKNLQRVVDEIKRWSFDIDKTILSFVATNRIISLMERLQNNPDELQNLRTVEGLLKILTHLPLNLDIWRAQNRYFATLKKMEKRKNESPTQDIGVSEKWLGLFKNLGLYLNVKNTL